MFKSDQEILEEFSGFSIIDIDMRGGGGFVELSFPNGGESVGGGLEDGGEVSDHFIIYDDGRIAFNNWYPDEVYDAIVSAIRSRL